MLRAAEELLRYEPPVHMLPGRTPVDDVGGSEDHQGSAVVLVLATANRVVEPNRFLPDRTDNQHLGLGSGIHSCFGAPLARLEAQVALRTLIQRLPNPRRRPTDPNPVLRGPRQLLVDRR